MKVKVTHPTKKEYWTDATAFGSSVKGWSLSYEEGYVFLNMPKDFIPTKGWKLSPEELSELSNDIKEFDEAIKELL